MFCQGVAKWSPTFHFQDLYKNSLRRDMIITVAAFALLLLAAALAERKYKNLASMLRYIPVVLAAVLMIKYFFLSRKVHIPSKDSSSCLAGRVNQSYWNYLPVLPKKKISSQK